MLKQFSYYSTSSPTLRPFARRVTDPGLEVAPLCVRVLSSRHPRFCRSSLCGYCAPCAVKVVPNDSEAVDKNLTEPPGRLRLLRLGLRLQLLAATAATALRDEHYFSSRLSAFLSTDDGPCFQPVFVQPLYLWYI